MSLTPSVCVYVVSLSVCLSLILSVYAYILYICLSVQYKLFFSYILIEINFYLSLYLYVCLCISLSIYLSICQSDRLSVYAYDLYYLHSFMPVCMSVYLSVYAYMYNVYVCLPIFVPQLSMSLFIIQSFSQNLTEIQFTNALDLGKVLWNGRYLSKYVKMSLSIYLAIHLSLFVYMYGTFFYPYICMYSNISICL